VSESRVAVITGASRGIGLATAKVFATAGFALVITGRDQKRLDAIRTELAPASVLALAFDVTDPAAVSRAFDAIQQNFANVDVLFNNAGVAHALAPVDQLSLDVWHSNLNTNLTGTFLVTRAAIPLMQRGSSIVNNLSVAATHPFPGMAAYNASKFGALGFTLALREDLRSRGIRVLALLPGATDTDIWQQFWPEAPRQKMILPATVAQAILHAVNLPPEAAIDEIRIGPAAGVL
jgi:NAD(P)-dependent dehydrogenase (short-subunit alcohol dehydrogenase family)